MSSNRDPAPGDLDVVRGFLNTHDYEDATEKLGTPGDLRAWLEQHDLLPAGAPVTDEDVCRTIEVREALRALCAANNGAPLERGAVDTLNSAATVGPVLVRFDEAGGGRLAPAAAGVPGALARLLAIVFAAMADGSWHRMKTCPADDCRWAFYDHSRNCSGTWCTMAVCGNRAKARKYRERHRHP